jgi:hypothetical protein
VVDGVGLGDFADAGGYFTAAELQCPIDDPTTGFPATLGIWVHEFGHDLGLIDLYDADGSSAGVDTWSTMGLHWLALPGEESGTRPPLPDPFSRWQLGWLTPTRITAPTEDVSLASSATSDEVIQVRDNPDGVDVGFLGGSGRGEYFLVENRTQDGYDVAQPGCGVLVWHIDESRGDNGDDDARRVDVEEAGGGIRQLGWADADDPYPSELPPNAVFSPTSRPDSDLNTGLPSGVTLDDFSPTCGPTQTLDVDPGTGTVDAPANDHLGNARVIRLRADSGSVQATARGHNVGATAQVGEPSHLGALGRRTVWWSVRAPSGGFLDITTEATFQEVVAVYTGPNVRHLTPVRAVRGLAPGAGAGAPAENIWSGLGFRVDGNVRYWIAVDARRVNGAGGIRLHLNFDAARVDVRPVQRIVAPGRRPQLRVQIRNASRYDRLKVYGLYEGGIPVQRLDCPPAFIIRPGQTRTCHVIAPVTGASGQPLRGKLEAWIEWPTLGRYSYSRDPWFATVSG